MTCGRTSYVFAFGATDWIRGVSHQVFAWKYRPQTFDDLTGQAHATRRGAA
ncbi:MAG: hypothetical protein M3032_12200 [Verrucomicrobiota bacterium]|nr:hypothetical protein [Verrucomicrobiota bacterium]